MHRLLTQMSLLESFIKSVSTRSAKARPPRSGPVPIPPHQPHIDVAGNPAAAPDRFKSHGRLPAAMRESAISGFFFCRQSNCFAICRAAGKATALGYRDLLFTQQSPRHHQSHLPGRRSHLSLVQRRLFRNSRCACALHLRLTRSSYPLPNLLSPTFSFTDNGPRLGELSALLKKRRKTRF